MQNYAELMQNYAELCRIMQNYAELCRTMQTRAALIQSVTLSAVATFDNERALTELIQSALAPCHQSALGTGVIEFSFWGCETGAYVCYRFICSLYK